MNDQRKGNGIRAYHSCIILLLLIMALTPSAAAADTMFRANSQHTGIFENGGIVPTNNELWRFATGDRMFSSPAVSNGVVYVGSWDRNLYAINAVTGTEKWRFTTGDKVYSSPAVSNGVIYVGSWDRNLYAINAVTGTEKWRFAMGDGVYSSPVVTNGVIYVGSLDNNLYVIDAVTGTEKWRFATGNQVYSSPVVSNGVVYVGSSDNNLYAIDSETGIEKWRFKTGYYVQSSPSVSNGVIYVGSNDNNLYAIDAMTGTEKWRFTTGSAVYSSPAVANGVVYVGSDDNNLYAIDVVTGKEKWRFATAGAVGLSSPAVSKGVIYVGGRGYNNLYAIDAVTGMEKWRFATAGAVGLSSPAVSNGVVYVGSNDNNLYAVGETSAQPAYVQPVSQSNSGSSDPSGFIILLIIGIVVVAGGYIGYSKIIRSKEGKPPSPPAFTSQQEKVTEPIPDNSQRRTEQTILNQINEIRNNPAVSSSTKSELSAIGNTIRGINLTEIEHPLKTYSRKQLDSINHTLNRINQKGMVFTRSDRYDNIRQMIDTEKYVEAVVESDKFLADIAQSEEVYDKATAYKNAMPDPDIVSLYNAGKYTAVIKAYEEKLAFIANAKPELAITLAETRLIIDKWHKVELKINNIGDAHASDIQLAFSDDFETRWVTPVSVKAKESAALSIGIKPKTEGNIPIEITASYKDGRNKDYQQVFKFWIDVAGKTGVDSGGTHSPVDGFTPHPLTPKQLPPDLADRYTESEFIGKGGFARVFKAKRKDGKFVAVKIPISMDAVTGKSFIAEMQNWTNLSHPNIVRLYDFNIMPMPYFEEELCDNALASRNKPIECEEGAWILFNICEGLKFAHTRKIIHRDLKPQNILLKNGVPKISDWGLSRIISVTTTTSTMSFTPYYAAPEQINNRVKDERTDIWQLGVILYELVTGILPFKGDSMIEIGMNISTKDPVPPGEIIPDTKVIDKVVMKCLQKDPKNRYQSVLELQKDLAMYLRENYAELLRRSVSIKDYTRSAYYCGDLVMINLLTGDMKSAYKYLLDFVHYSKGDVKIEAQELSEQIKMRMEDGVTEIPDELIQKAEIIVHQVRIGS